MELQSLVVACTERRDAAISLEFDSLGFDLVLNEDGRLHQLKD